MKSKSKEYISEWRVDGGTTSNISFIDILVDDLADASNTALILVVVLDSFWTACIGDEDIFGRLV